MRNGLITATLILMAGAAVGGCSGNSQESILGSATSGTYNLGQGGNTNATTTSSRGGSTQKTASSNNKGGSQPTSSSNKGGSSSSVNGNNQGGTSSLDSKDTDPEGGTSSSSSKGGSSAGGTSNKGDTTSAGGTTAKSSAGGATAKSSTTSASGGTTKVSTGGTAAKGGTTSTDGTTKVSTGGTTARGGTTSTGGTTIATGGTTTAKGGAATGGSSSSATTEKLTAYHISGDWRGFVFAGVDEGKKATISPDNFDSLTTDGPYCVKGSVPVTSDYSAIAMVIFNVNQAKVADATTGTWTPSKGGLKVNVKNNGGTEVIRVQIQGPNGDTSESDRWCAQIAEFGKDVIIPWDAFNSACWDNSGTYYKNQPLESALIFVPGMGTADSSPQNRAFDYCVNAIGPVDTVPSTGPGTTGPCTNSASASGTVTGSNHVFLAVGGRNAYVLQNNVWNGNANNQTLTYKGTSFTVSTQSNGGAGDSPISFPSIFIGSNFGRATSGSNLPRAINQISSVPTCLAWSGGSGEYNVAYDVWFDTGNSSSDVPTGGYLMLWFHDPPSKQPAGASAGTVSLAGQNWTVWYGPNHQNVPVVTYVHNGDLASLSFDLLTFIKDATTRTRPGSSTTMLSSSWYLTNVFGGTEIWSGGQGVKIDGFSAEVK